MNVVNVKPGDQLRIVKYEKTGWTGNSIKTEEIWTVVKTYKYHVLAEKNGIRECFCYGELLQMGIEHQSPAIEILRKSVKEGEHYDD